MISIGLEGSAELRGAIGRMGDLVKDAASKAVTATALELRGNIVRAINSGPATGRVYQKYNPRRTHQASAPGQAPMTDTGRLAGSITFEAESELTATVGSNLVYAYWLEYGTIKMYPRPVFQPEAEKIEPKFNRRLERALASAIK